jgi:predicted Rossmann fold nucleotide-binding protein DprA/Smf involved in DNA uptake
VAGIAELIEDLELGAEASTSEAAAVALTRPAPRRSAPDSSAMGPARASILASLGPAERSLAEQLASGAATADQLASRTALSSAAVLSALTLLELRGLATGAYGRYSPSGALAGWPGARGERLK